MPQEKKPINQNLTVPNALSVLRIIVIPFFAWFFMHDQLAIAVALLVLSGLSDCVDGFIARKLNQVTELGKMLDIASDRIFTFSRWNEPTGSPFRTRARKMKYRIVCQQKRDEAQVSC